jgi:hypothetical protein
MRDGLVARDADRPAHAMNRLDRHTVRDVHSRSLYRFSKACLCRSAAFAAARLDRPEKAMLLNSP